MNELPHELVYLISSYLRFRPLVRMSQTCQTYFQLLSGLINIRKEELFTKHRYVDENNAIEFIPGPATCQSLPLPLGFPIDGVYFFEIGYHARGDVNFFFKKKDFEASFSGTKDPNLYIATIKTEIDDIHNHELGCHNFSSKYQVGHWNLDYGDCDGDCNYKCLFAKGKKVINSFWDSL